MSPHLVILFILIPMFTGIAALLAHRFRALQRLIGLTGLVANTAVAAWALVTVASPTGEVGRILVSQMGNWPAPFGISVVVDPLSALMIFVASAVTLAVFLYAITQLPDRLESGFFHPLFHLLLFGVQWSFVTGDLFNLFVAFEIMLMASYAMFCLGTGRAQMRHAHKYVLLNLFASMLLVTGCGLVYAQLGTLNLADITRIALAGEMPSTMTPVAMLLLVVFGSKTAIFPLWYWLPETYPTLPAVIGGLFAGLLTKVGAYVMIRVFVMTFGHAEAIEGVIMPVLLVTSAVTMFLGVLGAVSMHTVRRILSIHIISQVGYMVLGIGLMTELAVAGAIFFILHNMVVKCCLFLCAGLMKSHAGSDNLDHIGGLLARAPWLATLFLIAALSLAGLPPLSGFFGKWILIHEAFVEAHWILAAVAIATSLLTLLSMLKIFSYGFWSPPAGRHVEAPEHRPATAGGMIAVGLLVLMALSMGPAARPWMTACRSAASSVVNPRPYVAAVLGEQHVPAPATVAATSTDGEAMP